MGLISVKYNPLLWSYVSPPVTSLFTSPLVTSLAVNVYSRYTKLGLAITIVLYCWLYKFIRDQLAKVGRRIVSSLLPCV